MANQVLNPAQQKQQISPAMKAMMFAQSTRQNWQPQPAQAAVESTTLSFTMPKVRLLSKNTLDISGTFKAAHATLTSLTKARFAPWPFIKAIRVKINNGFNPYQISGKGGYLYEWTAFRGGLTDSITVLGNTASVGGTTNSFGLNIDLTHVLNQRDAVGLVLAQNQETVITVEIDLGTVASLFTDSAITISNVSLTANLIEETFSIPAAADAIPDLSVLKLVQDQSYPITATGITQYIKLQTGLTYRKLLLNFEDGSGNPITDANIGNIGIVLNTADTPYVIPASILRKMNTKAFEAALPSGVLAFDWSYQGIPNLGGARDYVDTSRLTEFWISFQPGTTGNVQVVSEVLAQLAS